MSTFEAEQAIAEAARVIAAGRDLRDSMTPRRAAEEAHVAGGPSVDEIEQLILADRAARRRAGAA